MVPSLDRVSSHPTPQPVLAWYYRRAGPPLPAETFGWAASFHRRHHGLPQTSVGCHPLHRRPHPATVSVGNEEMEDEEEAAHAHIGCVNSCIWIAKLV
jgi:hypothetical protein